MKLQKKEIYIPTEMGLKHGIDETGLLKEEKYIFSEEELRLFVEGITKTAFYKGFEKSKNDDANCFTGWREEASELINNF